MLGSNVMRTALALPIVAAVMSFGGVTASQAATISCGVFEKSTTRTSTSTFTWRGTTPKLVSGATTTGPKGKCVKITFTANTRCETGGTWCRVAAMIGSHTLEPFIRHLGVPGAPEQSMTYQWIVKIGASRNETIEIRISSDASTTDAVVSQWTLDTAIHK